MSNALHPFHNKRQKRTFLGSLLLMTTVTCMLLPRCAQIVAPTGGPKDTLPPVLLHASPPDSTLHFNQKTITFEFNEFIQLQDLQKQMIIAPNPKRQPEIRSKLRTMTINWSDEDTLKPNTTYIINMGDAIEDINEGNPLKGFRYVFSTGDYLDSLEIRGKITDARSGLPDSTALIMLYTSLEDSIVSKEKPVYYARCKGDGSFLFQNLPHDTFKVFALKDGNGDLQYSDSTEAIAFLKHPLVLNNNQSGLVLSLFKEKETVKEAETSESTGSASDNKQKKKKLTYQASVSNKQDLKQPLVLTFSDPLQTLDSNAIVLQEDSTYKKVTFHFQKDTAKNKVTLRYDWKENTPYRLLLDSAFAIDTGGIAYANKDTLSFTSKSKSDYGTLILHFKLHTERDIDSTSNETLTTTTTGAVTDTGELPAKKDTAVQAGSLIAADNDSIRPDSLHTRPDSLYTGNGAKAIRDSVRYQLVVELYQNDKLIYSAPLKGDTWEKAYLNPGDYTVRVVKDVNFNGKWDRGCYYCEEKRQPEMVYSVPQKFTIRANWKNDFPDLEIQFENSSLE